MCQIHQFPRKPLPQRVVDLEEQVVLQKRLYQFRTWRNWLKAPFASLTAPFFSLLDWAVEHTWIALVLLWVGYFIFAAVLVACYQ